MVKNNVKCIAAVTMLMTALTGVTAGSFLAITAGTGRGDAAYVEMYMGTAGRLIPYLSITGAVILTALLVIMMHTATKQTNRLLVSNNNQLLNQLSLTLDTIERLQNAYESAEKTNKAKSKFLGRMSHDLRTPMNAIVGYSLLMEQVSDDPQKVNYYSEKIILSSHTLMELINDVLDLNCIETGNVRLVKNDFSLSSALNEVNAAISPQSKSRGQVFSFYMNNDTGVDIIVGDKQRLCQILQNILSNAVKYTPEGGNVDFIVNVINTGGGELHMLSQIKDTGCGMSREFAERLFEPFEREENEQNVINPGNGLGMCIAKSFVELMNGTLSVESKPGAGTLVTIGLPLTPMAKNTDERSQVIDNAGLIKGMKFLAAEDNESNAEIIYEVLTAMGAECVITKDGQEAVEVFKDSCPDEFDVILLDIQMPVMNGYQAAAAIRKCRHPRAGDIAIVAMTADAFEEDVQKAFVCGMNAHIAKPLDLQRFINTVESLNIRGSSTDMR